MSALSPEGVLCLANDAVIGDLTALCESVRRHDPQLPLTVIPFDDRVERTRRLLAGFGFDLFSGPQLEEMDELGRRYWPGETFRPRTMRKFCAFTGAYERFLFLDSDIVLFESMEPFFAAFRASTSDFMFFA